MHCPQLTPGRVGLYGAPMAEIRERLPPKRRLAMLARTVRSALAQPQPRTSPPLTAANLPAMRGRLQILRDTNGVPHIYAEHEPDLYGALGYLQGADRFLLLDVLRHLGAGRMCELVGNLRAPKGNAMFGGKSIADLDLFVRPFAFESQCEADFERLSERGRACLDAYAAGINAALRAAGGVYPPEYLVLGAVRPWRPSDALLAARTCSFCVALSPLDVELGFDAVRGHLGDEAAQRFFPEAPWENAPRSYANVEGAEPEVPIHLTAAGSNNWAVAGWRSASGAPIVANDPHVPLLPLPTFWYHAHLECPLYRIQGGLMLGCPIFGFGHNGNLAWGVTTAYRDAWDLYRIRRLGDDRSRYHSVGGSNPITQHREAHPTRFGRRVNLEWESCEHGIIYPGWRHHDGTELALRFASSDLASYFDGYLLLAESKTAAEHQRALARINEGPFDFNHVYAHKDGHFAWEPFGKLPRRQGDGLFVRDADDPAGQWDGFLSFDENPKMVNPERGYVASANSIADEEQIRRATTRVHVEPDHRQRRIEKALAARTDHSTESFAAMQRDVGSDYGPALRDALLPLLSDFVSRADTVGRARRLLAEWDGAFSCESAAAPIYVFTMREMVGRALRPLLGSTAGPRFLNTRRGLPRLQRLLLDETDPLRPDIERSSGKSLRALAQESFSHAVAHLAEKHGAAPEQWRWGDMQRLRLATPLGEIPFLGRPFRALEGPFPGDVYTISPSVAAPIGPPRPFVGATSRFICDLSRPEEALFAHSSGPCDNPASTFFANLSPQWRRFEYFRSALWKPEEVPDVVERVVIG